MRLEKINIIRFFLFTDGKSTIERSDDIEINGIPTQTFIWDIQRFLRMQAVGTIKNDTDVIISDFGYDHLSCSATLQEDDDMLAVHSAQLKLVLDIDGLMKKMEN